MSLVSSLGLGIDIDDETLSIQMCADDVVILNESEEDLQRILDLLNQWCKENGLFVNQKKSKNVHFRPKSVSKSNKSFKIRDKAVSIDSHYIYLGLIITEHLTTILLRRMYLCRRIELLDWLFLRHWEVCPSYQHIYETVSYSIVLGTISYGAAIWGDRTFSCISAVQNRAARFSWILAGILLMRAAVMGDIGWGNIKMRQWDSVINH